MDEFQAAVLDVKLPHLDEDNEIRRKISKYYRENIKNSLITLPKVMMSCLTFGTFLPLGVSIEMN